MKYGLVAVKRDPEVEHEFYINVRLPEYDQFDREETDTSPSPAGFYLFPETIVAKEAVRATLWTMLGAINEELKTLEKDKQALKKLYDEVT